MRGIVRSTENTTRPNLAIDSGEMEDLGEIGEDKTQKSLKTEESTLDLSDSEDKFQIPIIEAKNKNYESQETGYTIPNLPITIYPL